LGIIITRPGDTFPTKLVWRQLLVVPGREVGDSSWMSEDLRVEW
jgi:hypothetical protein